MNKYTIYSANHLSKLWSTKKKRTKRNELVGMQKGANFTIVSTTLLAPVVQMVDNTIHRINYYPLDSAIGFPNTYPLDSDLSSGKCYPSFEQLGSD